MTLDEGLMHSFAYTHDFFLHLNLSCVNNKRIFHLLECFSTKRMQALLVAQIFPDRIRVDRQFARELQPAILIPFGKNDRFSRRLVWTSTLTGLSSIVVWRDWSPVTVPFTCVEILGDLYLPRTAISEEMSAMGWQSFEFFVLFSAWTTKTCYSHVSPSMIMRIKREKQKR